MIASSEPIEYARAGRVVSKVERYGSIYVIERLRLEAAITSRRIPVVHSASIDEVRTLVAIGVDWIDRSEASALFGVDEFEQLACDRWASGLLDSDRPELTIEAIGHQVGTMGAAVNATAAGGHFLFWRA